MWAMMHVRFLEHKASESNHLAKRSGRRCQVRRPGPAATNRGRRAPIPPRPPLWLAARGLTV